MVLELDDPNRKKPWRSKPYSRKVDIYDVVTWKNAKDWVLKTGGTMENFYKKLQFGQIVPIYVPKFRGGVQKGYDRYYIDTYQLIYYIKKKRRPNGNYWDRVKYDPEQDKEDDRF